MKSTIKLFKSVPIKVRTKKKVSKEILEKTIEKGFIFSPDVVHNYSKDELTNLIKIVDEELGLTKEQMNSSFHKSWKKIKEASMEQLVIEQAVHYLTTYGFEALGIYSKESVYIPNEKLEIPELKVKGIDLVVIKGLTKDELKEKLLKLLQSGIALAENTMKDVLDVATFVELNEEEIENIKNKEVKIMLYEFLDLFPKSPIEFLRYLIFKSIDKSLLIKDKITIEEIKGKKNLNVLNLLNKYKKKYGLERLAEIFYRFKPIFLAFRTNAGLKKIINKIRRLAVKYHKPMKEDYLNKITATIKKGCKLEKGELDTALDKANVFRKIRLAYALKFRTKDVDSILYRIRNGKGWATGFSFDKKEGVKKTLNVVLDSIVEDIRPNVEGKKFYIPEFIKYSLPATEKQFTGYFPSGTCVSIPKDMVFGVHWDNVEGGGDYENGRIDLDLSLINADVGKIGWDMNYRDESRSILFSGDMTDAQKPKGASELFYVKKQKLSSFIMMVNYFSFDDKVEVPFKIMVAKEQVGEFKENYMINPNNVVSVAKSSINQKQKILGLVVTTTNECKFYFTETSIGGSITSSNTEFVEHSRKYLFNFYRNMINLNDVLEKAGAKMVKDKEKCDIDLSPEKLEKDTIINLFNK